VRPSENERSFAFDVRHTKPLPNRAGILLIVPVLKDFADSAHHNN
jgi:hypothetical protein